MDFVDKLKLVIEQKNISITFLAKESGLSRQSIYKLLNRQSNSTIQTLEKICKVLNIPITQILSKEESEKIFQDFKSDFVFVVVEKDNMSPLILKGDTAKIKLQTTFVNNDIILVRIEDTNEDVLKRVKIQDDFILLFDINNASVDFFGDLVFTKQNFSQKVKVVGKLVETVRNFD